MDVRQSVSFALYVSESMIQVMGKVEVSDFKPIC